MEIDPWSLGLTSKPDGLSLRSTRSNCERVPRVAQYTGNKAGNALKIWKEDSATGKAEEVVFEV